MAVYFLMSRTYDAAEEVGGFCYASEGLVRSSIHYDSFLGY